MAKNLGDVCGVSRSRSFMLGAFAFGLFMAVAPARAEDPVKVSLNAPFDGSNAAFFLAEERGYYAAEGIKPTFDPSGGSGEAVTRIGSGTYDFGFGDINVLLDFNAKNPANAGRAVYMLYYRSPLSIGSFAKAGISKPSDLADKKIGGSLSDGAYKLLPGLCRVTGIKADSIKWSYGDLRLARVDAAQRRRRRHSRLRFDDVLQPGAAGHQARGYQVPLLLRRRPGHLRQCHYGLEENYRPSAPRW